MGTKERRDRQLYEREQRLLAVARELIVRDGLLNLQMSKLAKASEHAMGTIYQHFASKEDLYLALVTESVAEYATLFQRVAAWQANSRDRMFAIAVADSIFVRRNPEHFRLAQYALFEVVWGAASVARREAHRAASQPICEAVMCIVQDGLQQGDLLANGLSPEEVSTGFWAMSQGIHTLAHAEGLLEQFAVHRPYGLLARHIQFLLNGMGWQPLSPLTDDALNALIARIRAEVLHDWCDDVAK